MNSASDPGLLFLLFFWLHLLSSLHHQLLDLGHFTTKGNKDWLPLRNLVTKKGRDYHLFSIVKSSTRPELVSLAPIKTLDFVLWCWPMCILLWSLAPSRQYCLQVSQDWCQGSYSSTYVTYQHQHLPLQHIWPQNHCSHWPSRALRFMILRTLRVSVFF